MESLLGSLPNLLEHSVPTVLVTGGLILFIYPFFRETPAEQRKSARVAGVIIGLLGIALSVAIKPEQPSGPVVPVYVLPTPANAGRSVGHDGSSIESDSAPSPEISPPAQELEVEEGMTEAPAATSTHSPPLETASPTSASSPTSVIRVWAIEENGVRVNIPTSGIYKLSYLGDAYSPWPNEQFEGYRGWTNILRIYVNRPVEWGQTEYGLSGPVNHDDYLGPGGYFLDKREAIAAAKGDSRNLRLSEGEYLTLVTLDEKGRYGDNQGKVDIGVTYLGQ